MKLQIHMIEKEDTQPPDVIGRIITLMLHLYSESIITRSLFVYVCTHLIVNGIIRSHSMLQRGCIVVKPIVNVFNCDVCGGLMFNAQRYMHMHDAYFAPSTIRFPYEIKKIFDRILHGLQKHPHHFKLNLDQLDRIFEYRASNSYSFPVTNVELKYMLDTLGVASS